MRPSQKTTEERKWVLDTINKYFDVIVEEENEEENDGDDEDLAKVELSFNGSSLVDGVTRPAVLTLG